MIKETASTLPYMGNSMTEHLGIVFLPTDADGTIHAEMPVDHRTCQPYGTLNGGASLALAETLTGQGSLFLCGPDEISLGIQVSGNHISPVKIGGKVIAHGTLIHKGSSTHIWDVKITTPEGRLVSTVRVVNYIVKKKK